MTRGLQIMQLNTDRRVQCCLSIHPAGEQRPAQTRASAVYSMERGILLDRCYILHLSKLVSPLLTENETICKTTTKAEVLKQAKERKKKRKANCQMLACTLSIGVLLGTYSLLSGEDRCAVQHVSSLSALFRCRHS